MGEKEVMIVGGLDENGRIFSDQLRGLLRMEGILAIQHADRSTRRAAYQDRCVFYR